MHFEMLSAIYFNLDQSKMLLSGDGLNGTSHIVKQSYHIVLKFLHKYRSFGPDNS